MNETIDFGRPFQFVFEDKEWLKKVLIGGLIFLIPILGACINLGYMRRMALATIDGNDKVLPEWDRLGEDLMAGLQMLVIALVYILPCVVVYVAGAVAGGVFSEAGHHSHGSDDAAGAMMMGAMCLAMPLALGGMVGSYLGILRFVETGSLGAGFQFGEMYRLLKDNLVNLLLGIVIGILAGFIAQFGILACLVGLLFTGFWARSLVGGHVMGQILRIDRARRGAVAGSPALQPSR